MESTKKNKTSLVISIIVIVFILFMSFWGFDMIKERMDDNSSSNIEILEEDSNNSQLVASDYSNFDESSRLYEEYGLNSGVIPTYGNPDAPILVLEFTNFYCGYCAIFHEEDFARLLEKYQNDIYYASIYVFSDAYNNIELTIATACSAQQNNNEFVEYAYNLQSHKYSKEDLFAEAENLGLDLDLFSTCYEDKETQSLLDKNESIARELGVYSTPFFLIDGQMLIGASYDYMDSTIAKLLEK